MSRVGSEHDVAGRGIREMPPSERPMERLLEFGPEAVSTAELIAVIIRCGRPGESAVDVAVRVLSKCGTARKLATAGVHELLSIPGIGPVRAAQIVAAIELGRRVVVSEGEPKLAISSAKDVADLLMPAMRYLEKEEFRTIFLDTRNRGDRQCNHLSGHTELFHSASEGGIQGGYSCR